MDIIAACKARAKGNYDRYHMFVECYGQEEWEEFVEDFPLEECYRLMDAVAGHWEEVAATAY